VDKKTPESGTQDRYTSIKVRLHPTPQQAELFDKTFGCCRYLWNQMLSDEQEFYAATGKHFIPTPAKYKKGAPFLKEVDSQALVSVHQQIQRAFKLFFEKPETYGYPRFKRKKTEKGSFQTYCHHYDTSPDSIYLTDDAIRLPKAGLVRANLYRKPLHWWKLQYVIVTRSKSGKYFCSMIYKYPAQIPEQKPVTPESTIGLHYSMAHFYVNSDGVPADAPVWMKQSDAKLAAMRRRLSRMQKGSKNYQEQLRRIQLQYERISNQRKDFIHKESRRITNAYNAVCVGSYNLTELAKTLSCGNVYDSGFGLFRETLRYKLEREGKHYMTVESSYPSAKTCHVCGSVNDNLTLRDSTWRCPHCGATLNRAGNAAINIKNQGLAQAGL
jgi:putative transposase